MTLPKLSLAWPTPELIKALIECFRQVEAADKQNLKKGQQIEMANASIILTGDDGNRYALAVVAGSLTVTPL